MINWPCTSDLTKFIKAVEDELAISPHLLEIRLIRDTYLDPWTVSFMAAWIVELREKVQVTFDGDRKQLNYL